MAADYVFLARHPMAFDADEPAAFVNQLEDGSEIRLETDRTVGGVIVLQCQLTAAQLVDLLGHYDTVGTVTAFEAATSCPDDVGFDADNPATTPVGTVRYERKPQWTWESRDDYPTVVRLRKLPQE